jgi:hypothetical protein
LHDAATRFCPPYEIDAERPSALRITLRDPTGERPKVTLLHRYERRLFLKASYLRVESSVPGEGPSRGGELRFRFRGWFASQRSSLSWKQPVAGGAEWLQRLEGPLRSAVGRVEAVQALAIRWSPDRHVWRLELETMSGSMMSGITSFLPIAVPFDREEAEGIIALIDALGGTRS